MSSSVTKLVGKKLWLVLGRCTGRHDGVDLSTATILMAHKPTDKEAENLCMEDGDPEDEEWDVEIRELTVEE